MSRSGRRGRAEADFLAGYDPTAFPPMGVTVDLVVMTLQDGLLKVLLVRRGEHPFKGDWALPGGFVRSDESLGEAAARELAEETGLDGLRSHLEQLATYGDVERDPRMRVVSVAYVALVADLPKLSAGGDAESARLWAVTDLIDQGDEVRLAFDHDLILRAGVERVRSKLEYSTTAFEFLEEPFTLTELRRVYEAIWGVKLDPGNFRRKVLGSRLVGATEDLEEPSDLGGRPAVLYRRGDTVRIEPPLLRPPPTNR